MLFCKLLHYDVIIKVHYDDVMPVRVFVCVCLFVGFIMSMTKFGVTKLGMCNVHRIETSYTILVGQVWKKLQAGN